MKEETSMGAELAAVAERKSGLMGTVAMCGHWEAVARDKFGNVKWTEKWDNLVTNQGLNYLLSVGLAGGTADSTWFVGLISASPTPAAGDTQASHGGWTEVTAYT